MNEIERLAGAVETCRELRKYDRAEIERLRANEQRILAELREVRAALEQKAPER